MAVESRSEKIKPNPTLGILLRRVVDYNEDCGITPENGGIKVRVKDVTRNFIELPVESYSDPRLVSIIDGMVNAGLCRSVLSTDNKGKETCFLITLHKDW